MGAKIGRSGITAGWIVGVASGICCGPKASEQRIFACGRARGEECAAGGGEKVACTVDNEGGARGDNWADGAAARIDWLLHSRRKIRAVFYAGHDRGPGSGGRGAANCGGVPEGQ